METAPQNRGRKGLLIVAAVLLVALCLAAVAAWNSNGQKKSAAILPDGTRVEVVGSVIGTNVLTNEKGWQQVARKIIPQRFSQWVPPEYTLGGGPFSMDVPLSGPRAQIIPITSNVLSVFVVLRAPPASGGVPLAAVPSLDAAIVYENGLKTENSNRYPFVLRSFIGNPKTIRLPEVYYRFEFILAPNPPRNIEFDLKDGNNLPLAKLRVSIPSQAR